MIINSKSNTGRAFINAFCFTFYVRQKKKKNVSITFILYVISKIGNVSARISYNIFIDTVHSCDSPHVVL